MSLIDWLNAGWLTEHQTSKQEVSDLLRVADRDLKDCLADNLSSDWQMAIAYNAALQCATIALAASGYRAGREAHHYPTLQSLRYTIGYDAITVNCFDAFRKKRNISDYERAGVTSSGEAAEMISLAQTLRKDLLAWLQKNHRELL